jgi:hypothetical protein
VIEQAKYLVIFQPWHIGCAQKSAPPCIKRVPVRHGLTKQFVLSMCRKAGSIAEPTFIPIPSSVVEWVLGQITEQREVLFLCQSIHFGEIYRISGTKQLPSSIQYSGHTIAIPL